MTQTATNRAVARLMQLARFAVREHGRGTHVHMHAACALRLMNHARDLSAHPQAQQITIFLAYHNVKCLRALERGTYTRAHELFARICGGYTDARYPR